MFNTPQTIVLGGSQLELSDTAGTVTITGPAAGVTISGGGTSRVFQVDPGVTASLSGLTISGGSAEGIGGGLVNYGTATLTDCTISGNSGPSPTVTPRAAATSAAACTIAARQPDRSTAPSAATSPNVGGGGLEN